MKERYRIGEIAKIKNIDAQTLRYYDRVGILKPKIIDPETGYRYYTLIQFLELDCIKFQKRMGLSLEEIKEYQNISNLDKSLEILNKKKDDFEAEILRRQAILKNTNTILENINSKRKEYLKYGDTIRIEDREDILGVIGECKSTNDWYKFETKLLELTKRYPSYSEIGHNQDLSFVFGEEALDKEHIDDSEIKKIINHIGEEFEEHDNVERYKLGRCIVVLNKNPYSKQGGALIRLREFIKRNNLEIRGDIINRSIINDFITSDQKEFMSEILIPIK